MVSESTGRAISKVHFMVETWSDQDADRCGLPRSTISGLALLVPFAHSAKRISARGYEGHKYPRLVLGVVTCHRYRIKGRNYPAIVPFIGDRVDGKVLHKLTDQELVLLDAFEDSEYTRMVVEPVLMSQPGSEMEIAGNPVTAFGYIWSNLMDPQLYGDWDYEEWRVKHLESFSQMCNEFIDEFDQDQHTSRCLLSTEEGDCTKNKE